MLAFAGQIYGDFSGYSDMAIGLALVIGFQIPLNFRLPYFASSPVDFWRRWHISLSTWLRDYLYIPLGGNRNNHRLRNIFVTMLLGGLWHGAAWTFITWGAFHGAIITATHYLSGLKPLAGFNASSSRWTKLLKWGITFYLVMIGWVLFRATSIDGALSLILDMHTLSGLPAPGEVAGSIFGLTVAGLVLMHLMDRYVLNSAENLENRPWLFWPLLISGQAICLMVGEPSSEFIYFQF